MAVGALVRQSIPTETVDQLRFIVDRLFTDGQKWVKGIGTSDWRRKRYVETRGRRPDGKAPSITHVVNEIESVLGYLAKDATSQTAALHSYLIVKPDSQCLEDHGIALLRPVLKNNLSNQPQLNFHVWFHRLTPGTTDDHLMIGWRLEAPEGDATTHNFFHAQPLRKYGLDESVHGLHGYHSERFPTIPLPASNLVELCLTAVLVACGKEALRTFVNSGNPAVRASSKVFWAKVFGNAAPTLVAVATV